MGEDLAHYQSADTPINMTAYAQILYKIPICGYENGAVQETNAWHQRLAPTSIIVDMVKWIHHSNKCLKNGFFPSDVNLWVDIQPITESKRGKENSLVIPLPVYVAKTYGDHYRDLKSQWNLSINASKMNMSPELPPFYLIQGEVQLTIFIPRPIILAKFGAQHLLLATMFKFWVGNSPNCTSLFSSLHPSPSQIWGTTPLTLDYV